MITDRRQYNGHTNWATWNVSLWIANEYEMYWRFKQIGEAIFKNSAHIEGVGETQFDYILLREKDEFEAAVARASEDARDRLARKLKDMGKDFWGKFTDLSSEHIGDGLDIEFDNVDWDSVAEGILEEAHFTTDEDMDVEFKIGGCDE
jgi:hypothetical protein